jgi:hypothetical protein
VVYGQPYIVILQGETVFYSYRQSPRYIVVIEGPAIARVYSLGCERRANLLVGLARIFVYYIRYINVCAGFFRLIESSAQTTKVAHVQRDIRPRYTVIPEAISHVMKA